MEVNELPLIEREACPVCRADQGVHCHNMARDKIGGYVRIWPRHTGSAGPWWVHKERRDLAVEHGRIEA